jgi:hypothetical protein
MAQPNKVDFGVRKVLKRKEVSRDCMTYYEHGALANAECVHLWTPWGYEVLSATSVHLGRYYL